MSPRATRGYRALARILPAEFRERWSADLEEVLADRLRTAGTSRWRRARVWLSLACDIALLAWRERFGNNDTTPAPESHPSMQYLLQDLRYAARTLRHAPTFSAIAIGTLAVGIAAATATYSVVYPVLIQAPPYPDPDRLVVVWPAGNANRSMVALAEEDMSSLERVTGLSNWTLTLTGAGEPIELTATVVSPHHFEVLGVAPMRGRSFAPEEEAPANSGVVVVSFDFWMNVLGGDPEIVGKVINLAGAGHERREIIGVMPRHFEPYDPKTRVWVPLAGDPGLPFEEDPTWYVNTRIARLSSDATLSQATAEVRTHLAGIQRRAPQIYAAEDVADATVVALATDRAGSVGSALWAAFGAVSLVLMIVCANLANLFLSRGDGRQRELALRAAIGASRQRIGRLVLLETAIVGAAGGIAGVLAAHALVDLLVRLAPDDFPGISYVTVDGPVLGVALVATLLTTLVASLYPIQRAARANGTAAIAGGGRGAAAANRAGFGAALIGVQIALALIVTAGSGLMLRSLDALLAIDPGLDSNGVLAFRPNPPEGGYPDNDAFKRYYADVVERVRTLPGVESAGAIHLLPGTFGNWSFPTYPEGLEIQDGQAVPSINYRAVRPGYFRSVRIPLLVGRILQEADNADGEMVVVVNDSLARRFWPGGDAVGKNIHLFSPTSDPARIVGIVADVRQHSRSVEPLPEMYFSHDQVGRSGMAMWITARFESGDPLDRVDDVQQAVWRIDADVPIAGMQSLGNALEESTRSTRFLTTLLSGFAAIALCLGAVGVYGVTAYATGRRRAEFGVRLALGASRRGILGSAMRRSLAPVSIGIVAGLAGARLSTQLLRDAIYGVPVDDPVTMLSAPAVLALVAIAAAAFPAWRASRVDPVEVLNGD